MLPDILRALGIFLNNEQMANAVAELTEEDVRKRRLRAALLLVKRAHNERRLPCPFDSREGCGNQLEFNKYPDIKPFLGGQADDLKQYDRFWEQDADANYQFEQNLYEHVGGGDIMMGLPDLVRIIVNYRQLYAYDIQLLRAAFAAMGARDRQSFAENAARLGERMDYAELQDLLHAISGQTVLPELLDCEEFGGQYLRLGAAKDKAAATPAVLQLFEGDGGAAEQDDDGAEDNNMSNSALNTSGSMENHRIVNNTVEAADDGDVDAVAE